jgi:hypothetical protein
VLQPKGAMEGAAFAARHSLRLALASRVPDRNRDVRQSAKGWAPGGATMATDIDTVYTRLSSQRDDLAKLSRYEASIERSLRRALLDLERRQARRREDHDGERIPLGGWRFRSPISKAPSSHC